jgi:hypothetical protein
MVNCMWENMWTVFAQIFPLMFYWQSLFSFKNAILRKFIISYKHFHMPCTHKLKYCKTKWVSVIIFSCNFCNQHILFHQRWTVSHTSLKESVNLLCCVIFVLTLEIWGEFVDIHSQNTVPCQGLKFNLNPYRGSTHHIINIFIIQL